MHLKAGTKASSLDAPGMELSREQKHTRTQIFLLLYRVKGPSKRRVKSY